MYNVIVIAGTADARQIVEELIKFGINVVATVATKLGNDFLKKYEGIRINEGRLTVEEMEDLIKSVSAKCLIDASHPYAREVSLNSINACKNTKIPYLRYEREETQYTGSNIIRVKDYCEAVERLSAFRGNILVTTGSNNLEAFVSISGYEERLFVRVLPDSAAIVKCEKLGLTAKNIIAIKGPFTEEMNMEMLKYCDAQVMVTKDSGQAGGSAEKLRAAEKLDIPVIIIDRPMIDYENKVSSTEGVVEFVCKLQ